MSYRLIINKQAVRDLQRARTWYESQRQSIGDELYDEVIETIDKIVKHPYSYPIVKGAVRGTRCKRFPYKIYFRVELDLIRVTSIYHSRRKPKY